MSSVETDISRYWVETFPVGMLQCNCTLIGDRETQEAIVVDPGGDAPEILSRLRAEGLKVVKILHTHAHFDHFLASGAMREETEAPLCLHKADRFLWESVETQCQMFGIQTEGPIPLPDHWLEHEEPVDCGSLQGKTLHTPGHTPGSMCFVFEPLQLILSGDTLFKRSIGRTDLWGGDSALIQKSIQNRLYTLDESFTVIPGHGPQTCLGDEMRNNPFVKAKK